MTTEDIHNRITSSDNIYNLVVEVYDMLNDGHLEKYIRKYNNNCMLRSTENCIQITRLLNEYADGQITIDYLTAQLISCINEKNITVAGIHLLDNIRLLYLDADDYPGFTLHRHESKPLLFEGPLNTNIQKYGFYHTPCENMFSENPGLKESFEKFSDKIDRRFLHGDSAFAIIPLNNELPPVNVFKYDRDDFSDFSENGIKTAIVPISCNKWFDFICHDSGDLRGYFTIENKRDTDADEYNIMLGDALKKLNDIGIDIAIFPEICMNNKTLSYVKKQLSVIGMSAQRNLKLVFLGSLSDSGKNECYLLSGMGTVLITNMKKQPFEFNSDTNGKTYKELLDEHSTEMQLLDVEHLGRLLYIICKDGLSLDECSYLWNNYGVSIEVVSSLTRSLEHFKDIMSIFATNNLGIGILANGCWGRDDNVPVGFVSLPELQNARDSKHIRCNLNNTYCRDACKKTCDIFQCAFLVNIMPKIEQDKYIKTTNEKIHFNTENSCITE